MTLDVKTVHVYQRDNPEYIFLDFSLTIGVLTYLTSSSYSLDSLPTGPGKNFEDKKNWNTLDLDP